MTKWFDTNYHYMVPEFMQGQRFTLASTKPFDEFGRPRRSVIIPVPFCWGQSTYLKLGKSKDPTLDPLSLLGGLLPVYVDVLRGLAENGADWVQIDEPCLVLDLDDASGSAARSLRHGRLRAPTLKIMLTTYFGGLEDNLDIALELPVAGLHLDLVRAPGQLDSVLTKSPQGLAFARRRRRTQCLAGEPPRDPRPPGARGRQARLGSRRDRPVLLAAARADRPRARDRLDPDLKSWLAFSVQKMGEPTLGKAPVKAAKR